MLFDEVQELSSDICCDIVVERWVEPYNVPFSTSTMVVDLLWFVFESMIETRSFEGIIVVRYGFIEYGFVCRQV